MRSVLHSSRKYIWNLFWRTRPAFRISTAARVPAPNWTNSSSAQSRKWTSFARDMVQVIQMLSPRRQTSKNCRNRLSSRAPPAQRCKPLSNSNRKHHNPVIESQIAQIDKLRFGQRRARQTKLKDQITYHEAVLEKAPGAEQELTTATNDYNCVTLRIIASSVLRITSFLRICLQAWKRVRRGSVSLFWNQPKPRRIHPRPIGFSLIWLTP